ncbi:MAG: sugar porter family MFS transporter [Bacteroidota bacterium]
MKTGNIFYWSVVVALAGFLFGFDTVVISGADQNLQELWQTSDFFHGTVVMSMALWGTVIGALLGGIPTDKLGRKKTLIWIGVLYTVSAVGSSLVSDPYLFSFFRFIGGLGVGASTVTAPIYVSEIAPASKRGRLVAMYQFNIVFGILMAFISNYLLSQADLGESTWRWMIGMEAFPAILYTILVFGVPNSPRWLALYKGDKEGAQKILDIMNAESAEPTTMEQILEDNQKEDKKESILDKRYRFPLLLAFLLAFFNQLSGINAFLYYAPRLFEIAGLGASTALLSSIGIGVTNLIFTMLGLVLIDRLGRKTLMYIGSYGYIFSLAMVAVAFLLGWKGMAVPGFLFVFIASHAIGQGAVIWVFISEIFPNHVRGAGTSFGTSTHWVLAALITMFMPPVLGAVSNPGYVFAFFAVMMVFQLLFVWRMMPETKGVPLEDLEEILTQSKRNKVSA